MLSIIIPTLNEEMFLPSLFESIKKQTFRDYEIIIADAGSSDKTVEIAKNYNCNIITGGLPARGRNEGAKVAKGNIILFTDADSIFLSPNLFENLLTEFEKRKLDVASLPIYVEGNIIDSFAYKFYNWFVKTTQKILPHASNCILVRKEIHEKIGGFDEKIKFAEDQIYAREAAKYGKFGFIETEPVLTSSRRAERDGRIITYLRCVSCEVYMILFGAVKSDIFMYRFHSYKKEKD